MKLLSFSSYEEYIKQQRRTDRRKRLRPCLSRVEVSDVAHWLRHHNAIVSTGMCHGARQGQEVDWYQDEFPRAKVWGTDLFPKGHDKVVQHDFHEENPKWVGAFDFVYSNALDHSYDPVKALTCWFGQLKENGYLLTQWSRWHVTTRGGDCFGAEFHEYISMIGKIGQVMDVIYHGNTILTIVARKRHA